MTAQDTTTKRYRLKADIPGEMAGEIINNGWVRLRYVIDGACLETDVPLRLVEEVPAPAPAEPNECAAYLIGDLLAVRWPGSKAPTVAWAIRDDRSTLGYLWCTWTALWERFGGPGVEIRKLVAGETIWPAPPRGECPISLPCGGLFERLPDGGWLANGDVDDRADWAPLLPDAATSTSHCNATADVRDSLYHDSWICTDHVGDWHVAVHAIRDRQYVVAVWREPNGGRA